LFTPLFFIFFVCMVLGGTLASSRPAHRNQAQLDQLIPKEKWTGSGLNKLTVPEQEALAGEITSLLGTAQSARASAPAVRDRSQWRKLQRKMSKDEVRNLLGEPVTVSVTRFYQSWSYPGGTVTFDGKGRVDFWSEI
jgi:hypothetical protein